MEGPTEVSLPAPVTAQSADASAPPPAPAQLVESQAVIPAPTATVETAPKVEVTEDIQKHEAEVIVNSLLNRKGKELRKTGWQTLTPEEKSLHFLVGIQEAPVGPYKDSIPITGSNALTYELDGTIGTLIDITAGNQKTLTCTWRSPDGKSFQSVEINRDELAKKQFLSEQNKILSLFSGNEKALLQYYVDSLTGNKPTLSGEAFDKAIQEAAKNFGFLTVNDLEAFINAYYQNVVPPAGATPEQKTQADLENQKLVAQRQERMNLFKGRNIVDPDIMLEMFSNMQITTDTINQQIADFEGEIGKIDKLVNLPDGAPVTLPDGTLTKMSKDVAQRLKEDREVAVAMGKFFKNAASTIAEGEPIQAYFDGVVTGDISQKDAQEFVAMIRKGDIDGIISKSNPDLQAKADDNEATSRKKIRMRSEMNDKLKKIGFTGLIGMAVAFYMMMSGMKKE